jgi:hypothetical protein
VFDLHGVVEMEVDDPLGAGKSVRGIPVDGGAAGQLPVSCSVAPSFQSMRSDPAS